MSMAAIEDTARRGTSGKHAGNKMRQRGCGAVKERGAEIGETQGKGSLAPLPLRRRCGQSGRCLWASKMRWARWRRRARWARLPACHKN